MLPTLQIGDHLLVNKFIYGIRVPFTGALLIPIKNPAHGDVIVFRYPMDHSTDYIKRVVGVPGDKIMVKNKQLYLNDEKAVDSYAHYTSNVSQRDNFGPVTVPPGKYFVMGDNRDNSSDSRFWGYVDNQELLGKAMILYWSWDTSKPLFSWERFSSIRWGRLGDIIH